MVCIHCEEQASPVDLSPTSVWCQNCGTLMVGDEDGQIKYWHIPHQAKRFQIPAWQYVLNCLIALMTGIIIARGTH